MNKNTVRWWIILAVILAVYNIIVFAVPFSKSAVFFLSWFFTLAAIGAQIYVIRTAFYQGEGAKSKFYGWPIAKIGVVYLIVQMALGLLFMMLGSGVKLWIPLILYVILLGISAVGFVASDAMRDEVEHQDIRLKKDVACMRALQSKAASMVQLAQDSQILEALKKFSEDLQFSDPVSSKALTDIEADLTVCVDELYQAIVDNDCDNAIGSGTESWSCSDGAEQIVQTGQTFHTLGKNVIVRGQYAGRMSHTVSTC